MTPWAYLAVLTSCHDKLHGVFGPDLRKQREVAFFSRRRALDVHADRGVLLDGSKIDRAVCLDVDHRAALCKRCKEREERIGLEQRLATRDADIARVLAPALFEDIVLAHGDTGAECFLCIAPAAGKVAAAKPDKKAGSALPHALTLGGF